MTDYEPKYWNNKGRYQEEYDKLYHELVPDYGDADTIKGELLRCVSKLYHDVYNNGGWNFSVLRDEIAILRMWMKKYHPFYSGKYGLSRIITKFEEFSKNADTYNGDSDEYQYFSFDDDFPVPDEEMDNLCDAIILYCASGKE